MSKMGKNGFGDDNATAPNVIDQWEIVGTPKYNENTGTYDSADFTATNGGKKVTGSVSDGNATVNVSNGSASLGVRYSDSGVSGNVGYKIGNDLVSMAMNYSSTGVRTGTVSVTFPGGITGSISTSQVGYTQTFSNGWSASFTGGFGSNGSSLSFSSPSSSSGFSMSFGASKASGGGWKVDAKFKLQAL